MYKGKCTMGKLAVAPAAGNFISARRASEVPDGVPGWALTALADVAPQAVSPLRAPERLSSFIVHCALRIHLAFPHSVHPLALPQTSGLLFGLDVVGCGQTL